MASKTKEQILKELFEAVTSYDQEAARTAAQNAIDAGIPALEAVDGKVQVPDAPGWGVEINPQWLEKAERRVSEE